MTTLVSTPFSGMPREGVEDVHLTLQNGATAMRAAIETSVRDHEERIVDIFHPSIRFLQVEWENPNILDWSKYYKGRLRDDVVGSVFLTFVVVGVMCFLAILAAGDTVKGHVALSALFGLSALGALIVGGRLCIKPVGKWLKERRLGYTEHFKRCMKWRINNAWAISDNAIYVAEIDKKNDAFIHVSRTAFDDISACAWFDSEGVDVAHLYDKAGKIYTIASPHGPEVLCAADIVGRVRHLVGS